MIWNTSKTVCITPQPCHSHFCCWWLPIWPKLDFWAENGAYGLCQLDWRYNGAKLSLSWTYMIVSIIWNTSETVSITPQTCHSHFCCWLLPIWPYYKLYEILMNCLHYTPALPQPFVFLIPANLAQAGFLGWKLSLWPVRAWLVVKRSKYLFFLTLYDNINDMKQFVTVWITPQPWHSHFCCWWLPIWS